MLQLSLDPSHYLQQFHRWRFKNTFLLAASLMLFFVLLKVNPAVFAGLQRVGELGYVGAFLAGVFFTSVYTIAPAGVILVDLSLTLNPWAVAVLGGAGGVLGDYLIFRFLRNNVLAELLPVIHQYGRPVQLLFRTPYFSWLIPIIGALLIASPLPDELGVGLLSASKLRSGQFLFVVLVMNTLGIFALISAAALVR